MKNKNFKDLVNDYRILRIISEKSLQSLNSAYDNGDVFPITVGGRILTFFILMLGIGIVTVPAGIFSSALSKARELTDK